MTRGKTENRAHVGEGKRDAQGDYGVPEPCCRLGTSTTNKYAGRFLTAQSVTPSARTRTQNDGPSGSWRSVAGERADFCVDLPAQPGQEWLTVAEYITRMDGGGGTEYVCADVRVQREVGVEIGDSEGMDRCVVAARIPKAYTDCLRPGNEFEEVRCLMFFLVPRNGSRWKGSFWFDRYAVLGNERQQKRSVAYCASREKARWCDSGVEEASY